MDAPKPLIVQGDRSMFLEVANPLYEDALVSAALSLFLLLSKRAFAWRKRNKFLA